MTLRFLVLAILLFATTGSASTSVWVGANPQQKIHVMSSASGDLRIDVSAQLYTAFVGEQKNLGEVSIIVLSGNPKKAYIVSRRQRMFLETQVTPPSKTERSKLRYELKSKDERHIKITDTQSGDRITLGQGKLCETTKRFLKIFRLLQPYSSSFEGLLPEDFKSRGVSSLVLQKHKGPTVSLQLQSKDPEKVSDERFTMPKGFTKLDTRSNSVFKKLGL